MSDERAVKAELDSLPDGEVISDGCARTIAAWWHSPSRRDEPMSALSHTGAVDVDALAWLIDHNKGEASDGDDMDARDHVRALDALAAYARHHGDRGPVAGWSNVWVR